METRLFQEARSGTTELRSPVCEHDFYRKAVLFAETWAGWTTEKQTPKLKTTRTRVHISTLRLGARCFERSDIICPGFGHFGSLQKRCRFKSRPPHRPGK